MRYLTILLSFAMVSCVKVGTNDLVLSDLDAPLSRQTSTIKQAGFWESMRDLDFSSSQAYTDSSEEKQFSQALQSMMMGDYDSAEVVLQHLVATSSDSLFVKHSGTLLTGIYTLSFNWDALIELDQILPEGIDENSTISMINAWAKQTPEKIHYPDTPLKIASKASLSGVPMIEVKVNGIDQSFWVDTGAEFTVLSSDIAEKCGVKPLVKEASLVGTATDEKISLWPGIIEELKIGDLVIENHPTFIIGKKDLEFKILKIIRILKIDGILGWNALQNLRMEINYAENSILFQKPEYRDVREKNFHFLTTPFITVQDTLGHHMAFFLDTGANKTSLYDPALEYFDTSKAKATTAIIGGAGGSQKITQLQLPSQSLVLAKTRIDFQDISTTPAMGDTDEGFILYDGILGSDVPANGILILDFQNGWCELKRN